MNSVETSLYTIASALCVFAAGLLRGRTRRDWSLSWLTWFLVIEAAAFSLELLMVHPAAPLKGLWLGLRLGASLLIAPCLCLAVREIVDGVRPRWTDLGRGQLVAIALGLVLTAPLLEDAHWGVTYNNPAQPVSWLHARFIHTTMLGCIGIFAVQAPLFLWRCRRLLVGRARASGESLRWLQLPLAIVATTWALGLLRTLQCATHAPKELALVFALTDVGVTVGAVYFLLRRLPAFVSPAPASPAPYETTPAAVPSAKYARSSLDAATCARIQRKLREALTRETVYGDSLLNLRSLSRVIGEKPHYVSQVINQQMESSFYALVNRCRIERAKELLTQAPDRTVLEIALAVGFNSKSTFNTAFRRETGITPSDFRAKRPD